MHPMSTATPVSAFAEGGVTNEVTCSATTAACVKAISSMSPRAHAPPSTPMEGTNNTSKSCAWLTPEARTPSITEMAAAGSWSTKAWYSLSGAWSDIETRPP